MASQKQWGGRFREPTDSLMERLNASISFDQKFWPQDIRASKAHAAMLARQGIISQEDAQSIINGLEQVAREIDQGKMQWQVSLEDIHTHVEARLKELIGEAAGRLHTARSRNDQVATDFRLWIMEAGDRLDEAILEYQRSLLLKAEAHCDLIMPGYTHLQRAQPVLFAHHLMAYIEMAWRDRERLRQCLERTKVLPLGAAALAGTTYNIDPVSVAKELGFSTILKNSLDAVSDRDFAAEFLFVLSLLQVHLSRLSEELILWSTTEFGFITLSDAFTTGSSIMPQKKNPDAAELVRGKTGRVLGDLVSLLTTLKALPLAYNKDLQEDKEPVFDAFDTVYDCLKVLAPMLESMTVNKGSLRAAVTGGFLNATELADYLVTKGLAFRKAHEISGQAVRLAEENNLFLNDISLTQYKKLCPVIEQDIYDVLTPMAAINRRTSPGGTAEPLVASALKETRKLLWPAE